jgi:predicted MFS family arabinose efflux permease
LATLSVTIVTASGFGYPLASAIVAHADVATAYWAGAAICGAALLACALVIPAGDDQEGQHVDLPGAALLGGGAAALLLVVSQVPHWGALSPATGLVFALAFVLLVGWGLWTLRAPRPLVDLRLAVRHGVLGANVTGVLAGCGMYMIVTMVVLLVQAPERTGYGLGRSVTWAGLMLVPFSVASVLGSWFGRRLVRLVGPDQQLTVGCAWIAGGALWLTCLRDYLWQTAVGMVLCGLGSGNVFASMPGLIVRFVPLPETGSAMSFNQILRYLGFSAGSALVVTVLELSSEGRAITDGGFTAAFLASVGVSLAGAVVGVWLGLSVRRGEPHV